MVHYIVKRDGKTVDFEERKIANAILGAMAEVGKKSNVLASNLADQVCKKIKKSVISVEEIQDIVETVLIENKQVETAKAFIKYRAERSRVREMNSNMMKHIKDTMMCKNVTNANANMDEYSFGGRKNEAGNVMQKELALAEFIAPEIAEAYKNNEMYIHDVSDYPNGMHNCIFSDNAKLLSGGFDTRNGDVRKANSFSTACQLVAVIFQCQSQAI